MTRTTTKSSISKSELKHGKSGDLGLPAFFHTTSRTVMPTLFRDIETRSTLSLADCGAWRYAAEQTT